MSSSKQKSSSRRRGNQPAPLPPLSEWRPQPPPALPPQRRHELPFDDQKRANFAHKSLNNREHLIWIASKWNESVPQTELRLEKMLHQPSADLKDNNVIYKDLKHGDKIPEALLKLIKEDDFSPGYGGGEDEEMETEDMGKLKSEGKGKEKATIAQQDARAVRFEQDAMELVGETTEDEDDGGVPIQPPPVIKAGRKRAR